VGIPLAETGSAVVPHPDKNRKRVNININEKRMDGIVQQEEGSANLT
jgi:hypothetical protein